MEAFHRKNEGMLLVCQNNDARSITIQSMNGIMEQILGYREDELKGEEFSSVLAPKHAEMLSDYVEYEEDANDLHAVLQKVAEIRLMRKNRSEIKTGFKLVRAEAKNRHHWFRLLVEDQEINDEAVAFKQAVVDNFKGHEVIDNESGLPDAASLNKDLELAQFYAESKNLRACYAYLRVDDFVELEKQYGRKTAVDAIYHISRVLKRNLRADDTIGRVGDMAIGVILMDLPIESARVVLNRLRWHISADAFPLPDGAPKRPLTVSVCLAKIGEDKAANLNDRSAQVLNESPLPNAFLELYKS
ncbi:MAG: diguanylate cyclase [Rickettsiales bacterium]